MYGKRIKECRIEKGLTQTELAEKLSTTQSTIGKYEREELQPNIDTLIQICRLFEVSADYLIGLEDDTGSKIYTNKNHIENINNYGKIDIK